MFSCSALRLPCAKSDDRRSLAQMESKARQLEERLSIRDAEVDELRRQLYVPSTRLSSGSVSAASPPLACRLKLAV